MKIDSAEYLARLNERLSSDSAYLWKIDDLNREIDKLYFEFELVGALNKIFSEPQKNYYNARQELLAKLNRIKIPRTIIEKNLLELKNIFVVFSAIINNSVKNFEQAANEIESHAEQFKTFFEDQFKLFSFVVSQHFKGEVDEKIVDSLYRNVSGRTFFNGADEFFGEISRTLQTARQNEKSQIFFETWQKITDSNSPADWSDKNEIPILCAFQDCLGAAEIYFGALNGDLQLKYEQFDEAVKFLQSDRLARLNDKNFCEQEFVKYFCGDNYSVVMTAENLREVLRRNAGNKVYAWYKQKSNCEDKIKFTAAKNYHQKYVGKVREKIRELTAQQAQNYLEELIEKDALLGIRVLKNS